MLPSSAALCVGCMCFNKAWGSDSFLEGGDMEEENGGHLYYSQ